MSKTNYLTTRSITATTRASWATPTASATCIPCTAESGATRILSFENIKNRPCRVLAGECTRERIPDTECRRCDAIFKMSRGCKWGNKRDENCDNKQSHHLVRKKGRGKKKKKKTSFLPQITQALAERTAVDLLGYLSTFKASKCSEDAGRFPALYSSSPLPGG